jgi:malate dehydrogenase (quinone)
MSRNYQKKYDVFIAGAGVSGAALFYVLNRFTNIKSIAIADKEFMPGRINSNHQNNSQTLHYGDIETNYSPKKSGQIKKAARVLKNYIKHIDHEGNFHAKKHKMVLGVGAKEVKILENRYAKIKSLYPNMRLIYKNEIKALEPKLLEGRKRDEMLAALYTENSYAVDYGKLAESFLSEAAKREDEGVADILLSKEIKKIVKSGHGHIVSLANGEKILSKAVSVSSGGKSLYFAKKMGYGDDFAILPVAGNFYRASKFLNGKVYTVQNNKLPFAALHGDPDVSDDLSIRIGPTAKAVLTLERGDYGSIVKFFKIIGLNIKSYFSIAKTLLDKDYASFGFRNLLYDLPFFGKRYFVKDARKIIPSLKIEDIKEKIKGGVRPQLVNIKKNAFEFGDAGITGDKIIFNITPSPGATNCLYNAYEDAQKIAKWIPGCVFEKEKFEMIFMDEVLKPVRKKREKIGKNR